MTEARDCSVTRSPKFGAIELCRILLSKEAVDEVEGMLSCLKGKVNVPWDIAAMFEVSIDDMSGGVVKYISNPELLWARSDLGEMVCSDGADISENKALMSMLIGLLTLC